MWTTTTQTTLRKCVYKRYGCENEVIKAYFHTWTMEPVLELNNRQESYYVNYPSAIIELEDGSVEIVLAREIEFQDWE